MPKLREELEGLQKQADSLGAASEAALQEYQSLKQVTYRSVLGALAAVLRWDSSWLVPLDPVSFSSAASSSKCVSRALHVARQRTAKTLMLVRRVPGSRVLALSNDGCIASAVDNTCSRGVPAAV